VHIAVQTTVYILQRMSVMAIVVDNCQPPSALCFLFSQLDFLQIVSRYRFCLVMTGSTF